MTRAMGVYLGGLLVKALLLSKPKTVGNYDKNSMQTHEMLKMPELLWFWLRPYSTD